MSSFAFTAPAPMSPHHRARAGSPIRDVRDNNPHPSPMHSPSRLIRRLSGISTPPSQSKSQSKLRKNSDYSECDRFIPSRSASNLEDAFERMESNDPTTRNENSGKRHLSASVCIYLPVCLFICDCVYLSSSVCIYLPLYVFIRKCLYLFFSVRVRDWRIEYVCVSVCPCA